MSDPTQHKWQIEIDIPDFIDKALHRVWETLKEELVDAEALLGKTTEIDADSVLRGMDAKMDKVTAHYWQDGYIEGLKFALKLFSKF